MTEEELLQACSNLSWAMGVVDAALYVAKSEGEKDVWEACGERLNEVSRLLHMEVIRRYKQRLPEKVMGSDRTQADQ